MPTLLIEIDTISDHALHIMQAVIAKNDQVKVFEDVEDGPIGLASALSDFFQICGALDAGQEMDAEQISEFADYGLHLLDGLATMTRRLDILDQRENQALVHASLAYWLTRQGAELDNLEGTADGFAYLVNGLNDQAELESMCRLMNEVIESASEKQAMDADRSNAWRPWRVLNLNAGIAATRSLNPGLMEETFDALGRRLPDDMPGFFADGKRQMIMQNVPDEVVAVMDRYAMKWPGKAMN